MTKLSPEQINEARELQARGWTYPRIAERFGVDRQTVKRALDPEFRALRCKQIRESSQRHRDSGGRLRGRMGRENATGVSVKADGAARLAEIPPDTRSLTGRFMGDPLPGRSSLDHAHDLALPPHRIPTLPTEAPDAKSRLAAQPVRAPVWRGHRRGGQG